MTGQPPVSSAGITVAPHGQTHGTLLGSALILLVALFYAAGLPWINQRIPGRANVPAGVAIPLGHGASYTPTAGWCAELAKTKPGETSALLRDASSFVITTFDWQASPADLVLKSKNLFEGLSRLRVDGEAIPFHIASGLDGLTYRIDGENLEGRVWLIVLPGGKHALAARLRGMPGHLDEALRDARTMIDSIRVEAAP
jgi:hypothetical protein